MTTPGYGVQNPSGQGSFGGQSYANISYAGAVAAVVVVIGSLLKWVKAEYEGESATAKGMDGDGVWTLIAGIVAIALFLAGVFMQKAILSASAAVPSLVALIVAVLNIADTERLVKAKLEDEGASSSQAEQLAKAFDTSPSFGLYLVLIGALVAVAAGVMAFLQTRRSS